MRHSTWLSAWLLLACTPPAEHNAPAFHVSPDHASMFGHVPVSIDGDFASLLPLKRVTVAGNALYDVEVTSTRIRGTLQGAARVGATTVQIEGEHGTLSQPGAFTYDGPARNVPVSWAAFGASLTQGTQSLGIDPHSQLWGVTGQLFRAAGVYSGMPLLNPQLAKPLAPSDFTADCVQRPGTGVTMAAILMALTDANGDLQLYRARVDPDLEPRTIAIGGSKVPAVLHGADGEGGTLEHMVLEPNGDAGSILHPVQRPQIVRLEALDPDIGVSTDLLLNDLNPSVTGATDIVPSLTTPAQMLRAPLTELFMRLGALRGQYFIANVPEMDFLPNVTRLRHLRVDGGMESAATFNAKLAQVHDAVVAYNALLDELAALHRNIHIVDFKSAVEANALGVMVDGTTLTNGHFGGLLSLDDMHFTDTGYALQANLFVDAINDVLQSGIPHVDVTAVNRADALRPAALRSAGLLCVP